MEPCGNSLVIASPTDSDEDSNMNDTPSDDSVSSTNESGSKLLTLVDIEISVKWNSKLKKKRIEKLFKKHCDERMNRFDRGKMLKLPSKLREHIEYIQVCMERETVSTCDAQINLHIFRNCMEGMVEETDDETGDDAINVANTWSLPNQQFDGLYER